VTKSLKLLTSNSTHGVLKVLGPEFEKKTGYTLEMSFDPAQVMLRRIAEGESGDVAMLSAAAIEKLATEGKVERDSVVKLARCGVGIAVRKGAPKPDTSTTEAFKRTLLAAKSIVYTDPASGGGSGAHFEKVLDRLGIAKEVKAKSIKNAQAATKPSAEFVARGEAELGIQYISEIVEFPGTELLGPFPAELQITNVIYAGILKTAPHRDAALALFKFLTSPNAAAAIKAAGMEPGGL